MFLHGLGARSLSSFLGSVIVFFLVGMNVKYPVMCIR